MKLFYELDEKRYFVSKNIISKEILEILKSQYSEEDIQNFVDKLISWYSIKFPNRYLDALFKNDKDIDSSMLEIMTLQSLQNNYTTFEHELFHTQADGIIILQQYLVISAGWGLLYHENTSPEYGFYRASQLIQDFNYHLGWSLNSNIYKFVLERNYSLNDPEIVYLLSKMKKEKNGLKAHTKTNKRFSIKRLIKK